MRRTVYRGISYNEAQTVIANQFYERNERRDFQNGIKARSTFGQGIYLISDIELAAQYAFCHAEVEGEKAAVLKQDLSLANPYILNYRSTEEQLRIKALSWKFGGTSDPGTHLGLNNVEEKQGIGSLIKEFLLDHGFDGIVYHIDEEIIYYISYFQKRQIKNINLDFVFNIDDLKRASVLILREKYKRQFI
ncbi:hypothetical protein MHB50_17605 [Siminovitchia sp. FSL H7-0308]|uniref:hypothetical protein n=1 Tax=Siminovitchia sp. FSL H7-0308 TaxID=2921432 RepID=UPI0030ED4E69